MKTRMLLLAAWCASAIPASARNYCGEPTGQEWDYRTATPQMMSVLEGRHFTQDIEMGIAGYTGKQGDLGTEYDYTLTKMPNHPRALNSVVRLAPRYSSGKMPGARMLIECYFERAVRIFPDDPATWFAYARYQFLKGKDAQALSMMEKAHAMSPDDAAINYNMGLVYAKQKKYEQALPYAQKAYALKFPLPALKQMLVKAGKWVEPPPEMASEAEQEAPAAAGEVPAAAAGAAASAAAAAPVPAVQPAAPAPATKP
ncbi:tetratricopeptide repeat protein [Pseudoduganella sp. HUAS MS19]